MLEVLTKAFSGISDRLQGRARLTEENIQTVLSDIQTALLDADVALSLVEELLEKIKMQTLGRKISSSLNPGKAFLGIVYQELTSFMGEANAPLRLQKPPSVILACGLQGVGKTTNLAKIAQLIKKRLKKRVLLASMDIRRPAAIDQLAILAKSINVNYFENDEMGDVMRRGDLALRQAKQQLVDVLLVDTAGRITLDKDLMDEIEHLQDFLQPSETLFFVDAMQGQDAINTAKAFHERVMISGLVVTKFDGDSRGGSALAAKAVTGQPIKFVGLGEKVDDLEAFYPDRFVSRILGMGDIASLAEQVQEKTDIGTLRRFDQKIRKKPNSFDLNDQLSQIQQMKKMGGISSVLDKLPGNMTSKLSMATQSDGSKEISRMEAIILSMTKQERQFPEIIKASRKRRIAQGAAVSVTQVNQILQQHGMTKKILKRHAKNPIALMRAMQQIFR